MTPQYNATLAALQTIGGLTVIATSWLAGKTDQKLPAVILDLENPIFDSRTEDGHLQEVSTRMSMLFVVEPTMIDPTVSFTQLETYFTAALVAIGAAFPNKQISIDLPQIDDYTFGKSMRASFGLGFFIRISDGDE